MRFDPNYLSTAEAQKLLSWLVAEVKWRRETFRIFGKEVNVPRQSAWFGEEGVCYRYTGVDHRAHGWPDQIWTIRERLRGDYGEDFNFVVLNRYRTGNDYMGWHRDAEAGSKETIASLSLGASRAFKVERQQSISEFSLGDGALLLFNGHLRHQLPKRTHQEGERINLTFRTIRALDEV